MNYLKFTSSNKKIFINQNNLLYGKRLIPLEEIYFYSLQGSEHTTYLLSFQYEPTHFVNILWLEEDELVRYLLKDQEIKHVTKEVVETEYRDSSSGMLYFKDNKAFSWGPIYDTGSSAVYFWFGRPEDKLAKKKIKLALTYNSTGFKLTDEVEDPGIQGTQVEGIIPLNPWEANEAYWTQYYKLYKPSSGQGCGVYVVVAIVLLVVFFAILAVLP